MKCVCCKKRKAEVKDFRTTLDTDITGNYPVCRRCFMLSDVDFFKFLNDKNPDILKD